MAHQMGIHTALANGAEVYQKSLSQQNPAAETHRSLEERRTYISVFYLSSWYVNPHPRDVLFSGLFHLTRYLF